MKNYKIRDDFEESSKSYNKMLRWRELEKASGAFVTAPLREKYDLSLKAAGKITITDLRVKTQDCSPEKGKANVVIEIDYFRLPSVTLKTVEDSQKWEYCEEDGQKLWRLMTVLPEFK